MKIVINEIDGTVVGNKVNLCDSCKHEFQTCMTGSADILFGDDRDDNVCCCSYYAPIKKKEKKSDGMRLIDSEGSELQWIPCSERLPEDTNVYIVTVDKDNIPSMCDTVDTLWWEAKSQEWQYENRNAFVKYPAPVIAWMPLPEPYKEVTE